MAPKFQPLAPSFTKNKACKSNIDFFFKMRSHLPYVFQCFTLKICIALDLRSHIFVTGLVGPNKTCGFQSTVLLYFRLLRFLSPYITPITTTCNIITIENK